ncbi:MAG TPA: pirin family protein [Planctomycetaceae bacterium]|nr:pirin family protein [Planctomycetaceae bacterium]
MIHVRRSAERGHFNHGWLDTYHTFSFAGYHDPRQMGFRALRVINEDRVQPGQGFGTHGHRDMEIVTYVIAGALEHRDSLGHGEVLRPGEFQHMSAGTGIEHSEFNPSASEPVHLYQIWLLPRAKGLEPGYAQQAFPAAGRQGTLQLVASADGRDGSITIQQDASIFLGVLDEGQTVSHELSPERHAWLQVVKGTVDLNGQPLSPGDGAAVSDEPRLTIRGSGPAEVMLFDLA